MGLEIEYKFRATETLLATIQQEVSGSETIFRMHTTYYDTPDGSLSARRWMLRCRKENGQSVCTLKTPGSGISRQEWEVAADSVSAAIPLLQTAGCPEDLPVFAQEGLIPICGARFTRIAKTVRADGCVVELALDSGILTGGSRELPLCEIEVELKEGDEAACLKFAKNLSVRYGLQPETASKFQRALGLYRGDVYGSI